MAVSSDPRRSERQSNLELFRILVMLLIVAHHYIVCSGIKPLLYSEAFSAGNCALLIMGGWGKTCINCFVMITGYFMCRSSISARKFARLLLEIEFYSIGIYLFLIVIGADSFSLKGLFYAVLPVTSIKDDFVDAFLVFYLLIPFLNRLIGTLNQRSHTALLLILLFLYCIPGTIPGFSIAFNYVSWFCVLYLLAAWIRLYPRKIYEKTALWGCMTILMLLLGSASIAICTKLFLSYGKFSPYRFVADSNTFLAVAAAFSAFLFFLHVRMPFSRIINRIAASTFGVLLIHNNSDAMRDWLWNGVTRNAEHLHTGGQWLHAAACILSVYAACTILDMLRIALLEKPLFRRIGTPLDNLSARAANFFQGTGCNEK